VVKITLESRNRWKVNEIIESCVRICFNKFMNRHGELL
jgi:hypothetical protein